MINDLGSLEKCKLFRQLLALGFFLPYPVSPFMKVLYLANRIAGSADNQAIHCKEIRHYGWLALLRGATLLPIIE